MRRLRCTLSGMRQRLPRSREHRRGTPLPREETRPRAGSLDAQWFGQQQAALAGVWVLHPVVRARSRLAPATRMRRRLCKDRDARAPRRLPHEQSSRREPKDHGVQRAPELDSGTTGHEWIARVPALVLDLAPQYFVQSLVLTSRSSQVRGPPDVSPRRRSAALNPSRSRCRNRRSSPAHRAARCRRAPPHRRTPSGRTSVPTPPSPCPAAD